VGKRRVHQDGFFAIVETHQADLVRHLSRHGGTARAKAESDFVVAATTAVGAVSSGPEFARRSLTEITESEAHWGPVTRTGFSFFLAQSLAGSLRIAGVARVGDVRRENNLAVTFADKVAVWNEASPQNHRSPLDSNCC